MELIDVDKFVASLIKHYCEAYGIDRTSIRCWFDDALEEQGLEYKDGEIVTKLVDSQDEKIKKEIIDYCHERLNTTYGALPNIETIKRWLAWLEKQKYTQRDVDIESMVKAYKKRIVKQGGMENNPLIDMCLTCFKHGVENTLGELDVEQILANSAKTCKNEQNDQTNFTEFEEALADVCRGWIGDEIGWKDYIKTNADALLKISFKMWNEVQDAPFEQKPDKCDGCNNVKGCVTCVDGDQWAHYKEVEQKPAWSEEDEKAFADVIGFLNLYGQFGSSKFVASLKDRLKGE